MSEPTKKKYDKDLKRARDRFNSPRTQAALEAAILAVRGTTVFDVERIIGQLTERKDSYKHLEKPKEFRSQVTAWATRQARLTVMLRELLQANETELNATVLFRQLPDYTGDVVNIAALLHWATALSHRVKDAGEELAAWMRDYSATVRSGIRRVTANCADLEGCIEDVEDELFSETWMHVAENAAAFASVTNLRKALHVDAYWRARAWKTKRLRALRDGSSPKPVVVDNFEALEAEIAYMKEQGKCPARPILPDPKKDEKDGKAETQYVDSHDDKVRMWTGAVDLNDYHNPIIIEERPWTEMDLARELRRAGPFRFDSAIVFQQMPMAA